MDTDAILFSFLIGSAAVISGVILIAALYYLDKKL